MSLLISGPRQPKNDIDIYLADIIEDLNIMWKEKVEVFDAYLHELFTLRAILFWKINDFLAYVIGLVCQIGQNFLGIS